MKKFKVINEKMTIINEQGIRMSDEMIVTLYNPPYEDETILSKTNWKLTDVIITEIKTY